MFANARFGVRVECEPREGFQVTLTAPGSVPILTDRTFVYDVGSGDFAGSYIRGSFDTEGNAHGTVRVQQPPFEHEGTRYTCEPATTDWTAKIQR